MSESRIGAGQRLRIGMAAIAWFILACLFLLALPVVVNFPIWVLALIVLVAAVLAGIYALVRRLFAGASQGFSASRSFGLSFAALLAVLTTLTALPMYYAAYLVQAAPTTMPLATLSNGKKTVVFQGMQHIGSEQFYKSVVFDLEQALVDGYTLFYEGVKPSPEVPGADEWFSKAMVGGSGDLNKNYSTLAESCGIKFQLDYFRPMEAAIKANPERHVRADVDHAEMKAEYDRLVAADPSYADAVAAENAKGENTVGGFDPFSLFALVHEKGTKEQSRLAGIACRGVINFATSLSGGDDSPKERIILDYRNKRLAEFISQSPADKIYITYGAAHLPGMFKDLQAIDPAWKLQSIQWVRVLSNPEELDGRLPDGLQTQ
jgi:hypothetical protein